MVILVCGDPHGRFEHIVDAAKALKPTAVILLGDQDAQRPLHDELAPIAEIVWWIHGNHDTESESAFANLFDAEAGLRDRNLHGRVVTLPDGEGGGIRIAGLGGVFRESVWFPGLPGTRGESKFRSPEEHARATPRQDRWRGGPHRRHLSTIYPDVVDRLRSERADILVTHEAPSCHPDGFGAIDELGRALGVRMSFHGHHHDALDYSVAWGGLGFMAYGVGMQGITAIDANADVCEVRVVVPGVSDVNSHRAAK